MRYISYNIGIFFSKCNYNIMLIVYYHFGKIELIMYTSVHYNFNFTPACSPLNNYLFLAIDYFHIMLP